MESKKLRLANNILMEIEAIKECTNLSGGLLLAELMTKNAKELAEIVKEEENK